MTCRCPTTAHAVGCPVLEAALDVVLTSLGEVVDRDDLAMEVSCALNPEPATPDVIALLALMYRQERARG